MTSRIKIMKNEYLFNSLKKEELSSKNEEENIFFKMHHISMNGRINYTATCLSDIFNYLSESEYYIAHNMISRKGKKMILNGRVFRAKGEDIISFLHQSEKGGDLRTMLIAPVFSDSAKEVFYISEEQYHQYLPD